MRFANNGMLLWWAVLPLLALLIGVGMARQRALLVRLGELAAVRRLALGASLERRGIRALLLLAAMFFLVVTLARPQWGRHAEPVTRRGIDVVIILDVSDSMRAEDVTPDRMTRARALAADLVGRLEGNRIGLVAAAGSAYVQCPLTLDISAVRLFLDILEIGDVPDAGSDLGAALRVGLDAFPQDTGGRRVIVLISDGEDHEGAAEAALAEAVEAGVVIYTVGVGTPAGGPLPLPSREGGLGGYKKDAKGRVVTTRMNPEVLASLAEAGQGLFVTASASLAESRRVAEEIDRMEKADLSSRIVTTHRDRYQISLAVALLFLAVESLISVAGRVAEDEI
jgi:Ca-activated chloride channel family protein